MRMGLILGFIIVIAAAATWQGMRATSVRATTPLGPTAPPSVPELPEAVAAAEGVVVAWTARAGAHLEPCGCVAGMHGGLARRGSLLARMPRDQRLTVENGGWTGGAADHQRIRARYFLAALAAVGYDAVGVGRAEVALGATHLREILAESPVPIVAANVRFAQSTVLPFVDVERAGRRLRITAVAPTGARGDGIDVDDPADALLAVVASAGAADVVVLADLDPTAMQALARAVPGLAVIIGGEVSQPSPQPLAVGATRVVHVANAGKTLGWWPWGNDQCTFELIQDHIPDLPDVRAIIIAYQDDLAGRSLAVDDAQGLASLGGISARYVGDQSCMACHTSAHVVHEASRHAHAFATLEAKRYAHDPDCLRCHVTGLGRQDGYLRQHGAASAYARVGCESCHGPGGDHVAERMSGRAASGTLAAVTPATCIRCHDRENSPDFTYEHYWPKIHHGLR